MPQAFEILMGGVTAVTSATALTMASGDSLVVRNTAPGSRIALVDAWLWAFSSAATFVLRSPRMHDNVNNITINVPTQNPSPVMQSSWNQALYPQDTMVATLVGSTANTDTVAMLMVYADLPGSSARFISPDTLRARGKNMIMVQNSMLGVTGAAAYNAIAAINKTQDNFKANVDYALVGYLVDTPCLGVTWKGVDTGNLRVGGPGHSVQRELTSHWFELLSDINNMPMIPVFNAANKAAINVEIMHSQAQTVLVNSIMVELG